jgi:hypothetical protein
MDIVAIAIGIIAFLILLFMIEGVDRIRAPLTLSVSSSRSSLSPTSSTR